MRQKLFRLFAICLALLFLGGQAIAWDPTGQLWVKTIANITDSYNIQSGVSDASRISSAAFDTAIQTYSGSGRMDGQPQRLAVFVNCTAYNGKGLDGILELQDSADGTYWTTLLTMQAPHVVSTWVHRTGAQSTDIPEAFGRYLRVTWTDPGADDRATFSVIGVFRAG